MDQHSLSSSFSSSSSSSQVMDADSPPFRFFHLPPELRSSILTTYFDHDEVIDIDFRAEGLFEIFRVSKQLRTEATRVFYGLRTFRILPTHPNAVSRRAKPVFHRLSPFQRSHITSLELRLGPFWTAPPKCWVINNRLGLRDATSVILLKITVQCDPSHEMYADWRISEDFYTNFCGILLEKLIRRLPKLLHVQFRTYPGVDHNGPLLTRLVNEATNGGKRTSWTQGRAGE